jgi:hypothetical protein
MLALVISPGLLLAGTALLLMGQIGSWREKPQTPSRQVGTDPFNTNLRTDVQSHFGLYGRFSQAESCLSERRLV